MHGWVRSRNDATRGRPLGWHPIPHRQLAQVPDDAMKMVRFFILARHYCTDREDVETAGTV